MERALVATLKQVHCVEPNTTISSLSLSSSEILPLERPVFWCAFPKIDSALITCPRLASISRSKCSRCRTNASSYNSGIQLDKSASRPSQPTTTEVPKVSSWCMMLHRPRLSQMFEIGSSKSTRMPMVISCESLSPIRLTCLTWKWRRAKAVS